MIDERYRGSNLNPRINEECCVSDDLKRIAVEIKQDMEKAREESINFIKTVLSSKKNQNHLMKKLDKKENIGSRHFNKDLSVICIIELTWYSPFFLYQQFQNRQNEEARTNSLRLLSLL